MASTAQEALLTVKGKGMTMNAPAEQPVWKALTQSDKYTMGRSLEVNYTYTVYTDTHKCTDAHTNNMLQKYIASH